MDDISKTNIFISHTPLQNFIASKIVEQFFSTSIFKNIMYTTVNVKNEEIFHEYFLIEKENMLKKLIKTFKAKKKISKVLKTRKCNLFIPHTSALLDNYFFYSFPVSKYQVDLNFYYEGILYFYDYEEPLKRKIHFQRRLFAFLIGFRYNFNPIIFPYNNPIIYKIYSILPEFTLGPKEKIFNVSLLTDSYSSKKNTVLIMGGKPSLLEDIEVVSLYDQMISKILDYGPQIKVYFKGHHADRSDNFEIANRGRLTIEDITQNSPIEEVIEDYRPFLILSYPSSGLVNLKAMYGDNITMISYYIKNKKKHLQKQQPVFSHLNIELKLI